MDIPYTLHKGTFSDIPVQEWEDVLPVKEASMSLQEYDGCMYSSRKASCMYTDEPQRKRYIGIKPYAWSEAPSFILKIRDALSFRSDYALCNVYRDEKDHVGWHADRESSTTVAVSVSLGASRLYQHRRVDSPNDVEDIILSHGDVFIMQPEYQRAYLHSIPPADEVSGVRLNITFRQFKY